MEVLVSNKTIPSAQTWESFNRPSKSCRGNLELDRNVFADVLIFHDGTWLRDDVSYIYLRIFMRFSCGTSQGSYVALYNWSLIKYLRRRSAFNRGARTFPVDIVKLLGLSFFTWLALRSIYVRAIFAELWSINRVYNNSLRNISGRNWRNWWFLK